MTDLEKAMKNSIIMLDVDDTSISGVIDSLISTTIAEFFARFGEFGTDAEDKLKNYHFIAINVFKSRFNRIEHEGLESYSQSEQSMTFDTDDFAKYQSFIDEYKANDVEVFGVGYQWL